MEGITRRHLITAGAAAAAGLALPALALADSEGAAEDLSFLKDYSIEELEDLRDEIDRLIREKNSEGATGYGLWQITAVTDKFGRDTDQMIILPTKVFAGEFSNSATSGSDLFVIIRIEYSGDGPMVLIKLLEYGDLVVHHITEHWASLSVLDGNEEEHSFDALANEDGEWFKVLNTKAAELIEILLAGGEIMFYMVNDDIGISTYSWTIQEDGGFQQCYSDWIQQISES